MLEDTIEDWKLKRISDIQYLKKVTDIMNSVQNRTDDDIPELLLNKEIAKAFYGITLEELNDIIPKEVNQTVSADIGLKIDAVTLDFKTVENLFKSVNIERLGNNPAKIDLSSADGFIDFFKQIKGI